MRRVSSLFCFTGVVLVFCLENDAAHAWTPKLTSVWTRLSTASLQPAASNLVGTTGIDPTPWFAAFKGYEMETHTDGELHSPTALRIWRRRLQSVAASVLLVGNLVLLPIQSPSLPTSSDTAPYQSFLLPHASAATTSQDNSVQAESVLNEVWGLVNRYFIDRTFNGQDWDTVLSKYTVQISKANSNTPDQEMKLIAEMVKSLNDKYSRVLSAEQYAAIQKFDLIGVGVTLMPNSAKQIIVGAPPIVGSAADKAGLRTGDYVTAVNGVSTQGRTAFDIIDQISDNPNAQTVSMTIRPKNKSNDIEAERVVVMDRLFQEIKDPIRYKITETRADGTKVGYIRIAEFNSLVKARLEDALRDLKADGANAFVLDLRMNTGGAFQSAVEISSLFIENRVATYVVDSGNVELPFRTTPGRLAIDPTVPMVVWIDGMSASASEVLAGSLHDNCRAVLMGNKSFGKGLIQAVYGLKNGAGLVLTVARYVTPSGNDIQGIGINPDISGKSIVPFPLPVMGTDTSRIDFNDVRSRLGPSMCQLPEEHGRSQ